MWKNDIIITGEDKASCPPQPLMPHLLHEHDFFEALKAFYNNTNMLSSGLSKHLRVMPNSFFGVFTFLLEGSRDFWHWFSGPFPYSISPSSSPYLHKPGFRRTTEIPKIHFKETVLPISQILPAHIHSEVAWPQLILTEVAIAGDIWSKYPSLGLLLMPWSFTSYFMRDHQSDQPDHLSDQWSVINLQQEGSSCI